MMRETPEEQKLRYNKEMASDNWKKYSELHGGKRVKQDL